MDAKKTINGELWGPQKVNKLYLLKCHDSNDRDKSGQMYADEVNIYTISIFSNDNLIKSK